MASVRITEVDAARRPLFINWSEIWNYRELLGVLAYRDIRVRYAQTSLGLIWAVLQPLTTLLIFTIIFNRVLKIQPPGGFPYPLFIITGLCGWAYFATVIKDAGASIVTSANMIKKVYFPRLIVPLGKALTALVDFGVAMLFVGILMAYFGVVPSWQIVFLPLVVLWNVLAAAAIGIWLSGLTIRYRDLQHVVPFLVQIGFYATPIAYSIQGITNPVAKAIFYLNPMTAVVEAYRWSFLGLGSLSLTDPFILGSIGLQIVLLLTGLIYFNHVERNIADIV
jgi:lipopolysaccharide transport system permease protein